jgi:lauroyl/myristoyl acyltransferase
MSSPEQYIRTVFRPTKAQRLRAKLQHLRARYDGGAVPPPIFETVKAIETKIAWYEHHRTTMQEAR